MNYRVILSDPARDDLDDISAWVEQQAGKQVAERYDGRIRARIATLSHFPGKGALDETIAEGVRTLSFERRLRIAYRIVDETVEIYRVFHAARDTANL